MRNEDGVPYAISELVTSEVLNPVAAFEVQQGNGWSDKIVGNIWGEVSLFNDFKFRSSIGTDLAFWGNEGFTPVFYLNASNRNDINSYNRAQNRGLFWIWQNTLSYDKQFGRHKVGAVVGTTAEQNSGEGIGGSVRDIPVNNIKDASLRFPTSPDNQTFFGF